MTLVELYLSQLDSLSLILQLDAVLFVSVELAIVLAILYHYDEVVVAHCALLDGLATVVAEIVAAEIVAVGLAVARIEPRARQMKPAL